MTLSLGVWHQLRRSPVHARDGSGGKLLVNKPKLGREVPPVRLRYVTMPVDYGQPLKWNVKVAASWAGGSGVFRLDYLVLVPARRHMHACARASRSDMPTGLHRIDQRHEQADPL